MSRTRAELEERVDELEAGLGEIADRLAVGKPNFKTLGELVARLLGHKVDK